MKTTKYHLVTSLLGNRANSYDPESFNTIEEAEAFWKCDFLNRNKGDGYDEHWRQVPLRIQEVITNNLWEQEAVIKEPTHKEKMDYLKEYDPITYSELHSNPTGADSDGDLGAVIFFIIMTAVVVIGYLFFFGAK